MKQVFEPYASPMGTGHCFWLFNVKCVDHFGCLFEYFIHFAILHFPDYNNKPHGLKYKQNNLHFYFYYENNLPFKGLNSEHIIMFVIWRIWTKGE